MTTPSNSTNDPSNPRIPPSSDASNLQKLQSYVTQMQNNGLPLTSSSNAAVMPPAVAPASQQMNLQEDLTKDTENDTGILKVIWQGEKILYSDLLEKSLVGQDRNRSNISDDCAIGNQRTTTSSASGATTTRPRRVMIYWDMENLLPSSFILPVDSLLHCMMRFAQRYGELVSFKGFTHEKSFNDERYTQEQKNALMQSAHLELNFVPFTYSRSEKTDNVMLVDMILQTGKNGLMQKGDVFIVASLDSDFAIPIGALQQAGLNVIVLANAATLIHIKPQLFKCCNEFHVFGDEAVLKVSTVDIYQKLIQLYRKRDKMEPQWRQQMRDELAEEAMVDEDVNLLIDLTAEDDD